MSESGLAGVVAKTPKSAGPLLRGFRWGPAETVIALATGLTIIVFAIFALLCVQAYSTTVDQASAKAQSAADIVADDANWAVGGAHAVLRQIAAVAATPADISEINKAGFDSATAALAPGSSLGIYDATGNVFGNSGSPSLPETIAGQEFFKTIEAGGDWTISAQLADAKTGAPIFVIAQRLGGADFGGLVALVLSGDVIKQFWAPQNLGTESTVSLVRADGLLIGRYPPLKDAVDLSATPAFTSLASEAAGTYTSARSPVDGIARVVGFRRLPGLSVMAIASVSQDAVIAGLWSAIITVLWLMVPIALALLGGSVITARILKKSERTQAKLAAAVSHNEVLFREIHHRVKNNLQSVASLLQMQPIPREIKADMGQRIAAMSAVHEHIYRSNDFATVRVKEYLETLIRNIRAGADPAVLVSEEIADLAVDKDAATPLGLILNEVVSNAFKHAFADGRAGTIAVRLVQQADGRGRLTVEDNGVGFDPAQPAKGIGRRLIAALTQQLGGESNAVSENGSTFTLVFPLAS